MAKLPTSPLLILGITAVFSFCWAQEGRNADACIPVCTETANSMQACGDYNVVCVCSSIIIAQVADCGECIARVGLQEPEYEIFNDHEELCKTLGITEDPDPVPTTTSTSVPEATTGASETFAPTAAVTSPVNAAASPSNASSAISMDLGIAPNWEAEGH
ncbi:hypothetical protein NMY22_g8177 [Coprinellus aureogranulatus]|nr:hypothetical protein NMY22_g8177 [Coprinellus aureogranulatus]